MMGKQIFLLTELINGQCAVINEIKSGEGMVAKLEALGIRPGAKIKKKSGLYMRGPIIVVVGNAEVAIGYAMAARIVVEVCE